MPSWSRSRGAAASAGAAVMKSAAMVAAATVRLVRVAVMSASSARHGPQEDWTLVPRPSAHRYATVCKTRRRGGPMQQFREAIERRDLEGVFALLSEDV